jgi:hypothetical protein
MTNKTYPDAANALCCWARIPKTCVSLHSRVKVFLGNRTDLKLQTLVSCARCLRDFLGECCSPAPISAGCSSVNIRRFILFCLLTILSILIYLYCSSVNSFSMLNCNILKFTPKSSPFLQNHFSYRVVHEHSVFWDKAPCSPVKVNWRFGWTYHLHLQGWKVSQARSQHEGGSKQSKSSWLTHRPWRWRW